MTQNFNYQEELSKCKSMQDITGKTGFLPVPGSEPDGRPIFYTTKFCGDVSSLASSD